MTGRTQEKTFNFPLGDALRAKHPRWPDRIGVEQNGVFAGAERLCPDIIVRHPGGLPVAVETEYAPALTVESDALTRLGKVLRQDGRAIEQAIAVRVPVHLKTANQSELAALIADAELEFCVFAGNPDDPARWPASGWIEGGIDDLAACIEQAALSEDRVAQGMRVLEDGIGQAATLLREACADAPDTLATIARELHQEDGEQTSRMAMTIIANAMTFHTAIAGAHRIDTLDQIRGGDGRLSKSRVLEIWRRILTDINYWPIFRIASDILLPIRNGTARQILDRLASVAAELDALGATSQHDLCGRMFQRLIADRKFLATFYTLPSSAALLAELAVARLDVDWADAEAVTALRMADFACGTGALLNAAYAAAMARHRRAGGDDEAIHSRMMERALVGADIMPAASHLTATVLSSTHPSVPFDNTSIVTLPYGEQPGETGRDTIALGALDLIGAEETLPLFGTGQERVRGVAGGEGERLELPHGSFDLVIMNPPFTRPTNHESADVPVPSFAGFATSEDEQRAMSSRLKKIRKPGMAGHGNAGLASNFIDIAHAKVRPGGVLALVLPASFLQGSAWAASRAVFEAHYRDVAIITIATSGKHDRAFSADTGMAETLIVGTRKVDDSTGATATFANLYSRPETILESVALAQSVAHIETDRDVGLLTLGSNEKAGCYIRNSLSRMGSAGIRQDGIAAAVAKLTLGKLKLPRQKNLIDLPLTELANLGEDGLLHRDLVGRDLLKDGSQRGPFDFVPLTDGMPTWPALWGHDASRETRLIVVPDRQGMVRPGCDARAVEAWDRTASRLHFTLDFQINSQPLAACMTPEPTIGGRAWPNFLCTDSRWETPLALWANTTLGLMAFWWIGTRQQQGRACITISRLPALAALDTRQLSPDQLARADTIFRQFEGGALLPANEAWRDETRQALDRAMLIDLLGLPGDIMEPLALLRRQWCAEPSVHGGKRTAPTRG